MQFKFYFFTILGILFLISTQLFGQITVNITQGSTLIKPCTTMNFNLSATHTAPPRTDIYTVTPIAYTPSILAASTILSIPDDTFSGAVPIGFPFCFFDNSYTNLYASRNGIITFNSLFANSACTFSTQTALPFSSSTFPNNAIFCPFVDLDTSTTGTIQYATTGVAPNRKFVMQWQQLPLFGVACNAGSNTFEVVLLETSNKIQMHITSKVVCNTNILDHANYATIGIQASNTFTYKAAPGRNASIWTDTADAWEFNPIGNNNVTAEWINMANNTVLGTNPNSLNYTATTFPMNIQLKMKLICGSDSVSDFILVDTGHAIINNLIITKPTCKYSCDGSITVKASSAFLPIKYANNNFLYSVDSVFNNLCRDTMRFRIKDNYGCRHDTTIFNYSKSTLNLGWYANPAATCWLANGGIKVYPMGNVGAVTYLWSNGSTADSVIGYTAGTQFTVTATDNLGCLTTQVLQVTPNIPFASADSTFLPQCDDSSGYVHIVANGGFGGPYTFLWNNGDTTSYMANMIPWVTYFVTITDVNGCVGYSSFRLVPVNLPSVFIASIQKPTCQKSNGSITVGTFNGVPPYTYTWGGGATTSNTLSNIPAGIYTVNVVDGNLCFSTFNLLIGLIDTLQMTIGSATVATTCNLPNGNATAVGFNGMAPYTYLWSNSGTNGTIGSLAPGIYTCAVADALACLDTISVTILPSLPLVLNLTIKNANCDSANGSLLPVLTNAIGIPSYAWSNSTFGSTATNLWQGTYTCIATDASGCVSTKSATLINEGSPSPLITAFTPPLCFGDTSGILTMSGTGGTSPYKYSLDGINYSPIPILNQVASGTYKLYIKDGNSCIRDTTVYFVDAVQINFTTSPYDTLICFNDTIAAITLYTTGGWPAYQYNFLDGNGYGSGNVLYGRGKGVHQFYIKDSVNCIRKLSIEIIGPDDTLENTTMRFDVPCHQSNSGFLHPTVTGGWPPYYYTWQDGSTLGNRDNLTPGKYYVYITDRKGCKIESAETVLSDKCCEIFVPNAFTPNGDFNNDDMQLKNRGEIQDFKFVIYDRWGQQLFTAFDIKTNWDGTYKGQLMPMETYFYKLKYQCSYLEQPIIQNGEFILIR
jgi:gliding motility-associated-like protein